MVRGGAVPQADIETPQEKSQHGNREQGWERAFEMNFLRRVYHDRVTDEIFLAEDIDAAEGWAHAIFDSGCNSSLVGKARWDNFVGEMKR